MTGWKWKTHDIAHGSGGNYAGTGYGYVGGSYGCTHPTTPLFEGDKYAIMPGKPEDVAAWLRQEREQGSEVVAMDLAGRLGEILAKSAVYISPQLQNTAFESLIAPPMPQVRIDWPDMGVPGLLDADWWQQLVSVITGRDKRLALGIACYGGHGRTGTAAAILGVLLGHIPEGECPVQWVRKHYCSKTVESAAQLDYVAEITGRKVEATASKMYTTGGTQVGTFAARIREIVKKYTAITRCEVAPVNKAKARISGQLVNTQLLDAPFDFDCTLQKNGKVKGFDPAKMAFKKLPRHVDGFSFIESDRSLIEKAFKDLVLEHARDKVLGVGKSPVKSVQQPAQVEQVERVEQIETAAFDVKVVDASATAVILSITSRTLPRTARIKVPLAVTESSALDDSVVDAVCKSAGIEGEEAENFAAVFRSELIDAVVDAIMEDRLG